MAIRITLFLVPIIVVGLVVASWLLGLWIAKSVGNARLRLEVQLDSFRRLRECDDDLSRLAAPFRHRPRGGAVLVYRVDKSQTEWRPDKLDALWSPRLANRVNPGRPKGNLRPQPWPDMVQITMPAVSGTAKEKTAQMEEIKKKISTTGAWNSASWPRSRSTKRRSNKPRPPAKPHGTCRLGTTTKKAESIPIPEQEKEKSPSGAACATRKGTNTEATRPPSSLQGKDKDGKESTYV